MRTRAPGGTQLVFSVVLLLAGAACGNSSNAASGARNPAIDAAANTDGGADGGADSTAVPTRDADPATRPDDATTSETDPGDAPAPAPADAPPPAPLPDGWADAAGAVRVRIVAANTTSGSGQAYEAPGIRIFQGVQPDIALIQEFNYKDGAQALVTTAFGAGFSYYVEAGAQIPNGIVSRFPIVESGTWVDPQVGNRGFAWARIDVPGPIDLWAVSVHLLTSGSSQRAAEATALAQAIQQKIPIVDYLVIGGDFNTESAGETALQNLATVVITLPPYPADANGNTFTSGNRTKPHDWLLANGELHARNVAVAIGTNSFASGLVFDSRVYAPLSEVSPVAQGDSAASGMQHMMVVRDFVLGP